MPLVLCPNCDEVLKISDREVRTSVRCTSCSRLVHLLTAKHVDGKTKSRRRKEGPYVKYLKWIPAVIAGTLGPLLLLAGLFSLIAANGAVVVGVLALVGGFIWGIMLLNEDNAHIGFDYLNLFGSFRLVILFLVCGAPLAVFYVLGYFVFVLFTQISHAMHKPKRYLPIVIAQGLGLFLLIAGIILAIRADNNRRAYHHHGPVPGGGMVAQNK